MATLDQIRRLLNSGVSWKDASSRRDVVRPDAITSADVALPDAVNPAGAAYVQADQTAIAVLANENKATTNALRAEVVNLRAVLNDLLQALEDSNLTL